MNTVANSLTAIGLLILRVGFGCLMLVGHGWAKLSGFSDKVDTFPDPIGVGSQLGLVLAIFAEFGCSILLILGLATRIAAIPLAATMGVALFLVHAADPWQTKELAAVYLTVYISLILTGPGPISLDHLIWKRKNRADR